MQVLADLAIGRMRSKIRGLSMALEGRFGDHHAMLCRLHLDHLDHLDGMLAKLDAQIEAMMQPFRPARDLLITIPGIGQLSAAAVISEIGADVREYFPDAAHLASWAGLCPGNHESAGKHRPGKRRQPAPPARPGRVRLGRGPPRGLPEVPLPPARHEMGRLPFPPRAKNKAIIVVAHAILVIIWHVLATGKPYGELGARLLHPPPGPRPRDPPPRRQAGSPRPPVTMETPAA